MESRKQTFISVNEVSIQNYRHFVEIIMHKHGENSELYKSVFPDTAKFWKLYGFPFWVPAFFGRAPMNEELEDLLGKHGKLPMVAISYEQAMAFCQWLNDDAYTYSLPTKADYEMAFKKAKITQRKALTLLQRRKGNHIFGLTDNVAEYTQDGMIVAGDENAVLKFVEAKENETPIGFRIKATIVSKK
jgi:formylglycine-generating enzyme required for sulfatase activity